MKDVGRLCITTSFCKCVDHNRETGNDSRECPYYKDLNDLYRYWPNVTPLATSSSSVKRDTIRNGDESDQPNPEISMQEQDDPKQGSTDNKELRKRKGNINQLPLPRQNLL